LTLTNDIQFYTHYDLTQIRHNKCNRWLYNLAGSRFHVVNTHHCQVYFDKNVMHNAGMNKCTTHDALF